ncbi:MAG: FecR domain-containing protein [Hansschlegelia sp.]
MTGEEPTEEERDVAAVWVAKSVGGSLASDEAKDLETWLGGDPRRRRAFDEARVLYAQLEAPTRRVAQRAPVRRKLAARLQPSRSWLCPPAVAAAVILVVGILAPSIFENWRADIVTSRQAVTVITLPDGSTARLGADTALALDFENGRRRVGLLRGEGYFEVLHDRPGVFTVDAGGDEVRDIGTRFDVSLGRGRTKVVVTEGAVEVSGRYDAGSVVLRQGDQVTVTAGRAGHAEAGSAEAALSWMTGRLVVQGATVQEVADALQRHDRGRIVVRGALAGRRISGTFPLTDIDGSLDTVATAVGGKVLRATSLLTVLY